MPRKKGTLNTSRIVMNEIVTKHRKGLTIRELSIEYGKPFKTIKNMCDREASRERGKELILPLEKRRGRKPAVSLTEYKNENKRLKMENELLRNFLCLIGRR